MGEMDIRVGWIEANVPERAFVSTVRRTTRINIALVNRVPLRARASCQGRSMSPAHRRTKK
jgi:hypothetical protein